MFKYKKNNKTLDFYLILRKIIIFKSCINFFLFFIRKILK